MSTEPKWPRLLSIEAITNLLNAQRVPCKGATCKRKIIHLPILHEDGTISGSVPLDTSAVVYRLCVTADGQEVAVRERRCMVSHFNTCPDVGQFHSTKKGSPPI